MASGKRWSRDELLVALNIYHKLNFGQFHARQPVIIAVAKRLGRTPGSLAMKLGNLASLDPALQLRGVRGLPGASDLDRAVWAEFHGNLAAMAPSSEDVVRRLFGAPAGAALEVVPTEGVRVRKLRPAPSGPTETTATVQVRRGQEFFRDAVLNNFAGRCGVTGLAVRELLIASHILPWGQHPEHRLTVRNGLSLSRLHDAAFDRGLIGFDDEFRLLVGRDLARRGADRAVAEAFLAYEGQPLRVPADAVLPDASFLAEHRRRVLGRRG